MALNCTGVKSLRIINFHLWIVGVLPSNEAYAFDCAFNSFDLNINPLFFGHGSPSSGPLDPRGPLGLLRAPRPCLLCLPSLGLHFEDLYLSLGLHFEDLYLSLGPA
ncbi:hypothetical protein ACLOJK_013069 [Asimina triloba]